MRFTATTKKPLALQLKKHEFRFNHRQEAQMIALSLPNVEQACIIDIGALDNGCSAEPEREMFGFQFKDNRTENFQQWRRQSNRSSSQGFVWARSL